MVNKVQNKRSTERPLRTACKSKGNRLDQSEWRAQLATTAKQNEALFTKSLLDIRKVEPCFMHKRLKLPLNRIRRGWVNQEPGEVVVQGGTNGIFAATNAESL